MGRSQETFNKKEKEKNKQKKKQDKLARKAERKSSTTGGNLESMMAYVDAFGNIVDAPVDRTMEKEIDASQIEIGITKRVDEEPTRRNGKVAFFNHDKGYGFVRDAEDGETAFVHINSLKAPLNEHDKVTYDRVRGPKGWTAENIELTK
jgi:cold shock CspA family protein